MHPRQPLGLALASLALLPLPPARPAVKRKPAPAKKPAAARKPAPRPAAPAQPLTTGAFSVFQPVSRDGEGFAPSGPVRVLGLPGGVRWLRNSRYAGADYPLFPPVPLAAGSSPTPGSPTGVMPPSPVLGDTGEVALQPARWLTAVSGSRALTVPVGGGESVPVLQLTPQVSGSAVPVGSRLPLGVSVTNMTGAARNWTLSYRALTASGTPFASGRLRVYTPAMNRVTTPLVIGPLTLPGSVTVQVTTPNGAAVASAATGGGAYLPHNDVKTGKFAFGLAGGDLPLADAAGAQFWMGGFPWWRSGDPKPPVGARADAAPGFPEGFFSLSDRLGIALVNRTYTGTLSGQPAYLRSAMTQFKRRAGGWATPYSAALTPQEYADLAASSYAVSKSIHKDALTFLELPRAGTTGIDVGRALVESGAAVSTDVLAVRGMGVPPQDELFRPTLDKLLALRDADFPAREVWNVGEALSGTDSPVAQAGTVVRSSVEQIAAGVDKVFWTTDAPFLREDGSAGPGYFGLSALSGFLAGAEYVGPMPWEEPLHGEVFQKNGASVLVGWSTAGTRGVTLPLLGGPSAEAYDPMQTRANLLLSGRRLTLTTVPLFVTRTGRSLLPEAYATARAGRLAAVKAAFDALGVKADDTSGALSNEEGVRLLQAAMDTYKPEAPARNRALNAVYHLLRLWDVSVLAQASARPSNDLLLTNKLLDRANHASADLRIEMDYKEGPSKYQHDMRNLLNRVEDRLQLARLAYRQKDFALAQAHAEQMTAAARALIPYVKAVPAANP